MQCESIPWIHFAVIIAYLLSNQKQVEGMKRKKDDPSMDVPGSSKKIAAMKEPNQQMEEREQHSVEVTGLHNEEQHLIGLQYEDQIEPRSNIWKIFIAGTEEKLFNKLNKEQTECAICKANGGNKHIFNTSHGSTSNMITHLKSWHKESEECNQYLELEHAKKEYAQTMRINTTLEEMKNKRSWSNIWKICIAGTNQKVFNRLNTDEAECLICKVKEGSQYIFKTTNGCTTNLAYHLKRRHIESEEYKQYLELERAKENRHSSLQIDQHRTSVESEETKTKRPWSKIWKICIAGTNKKLFNQLNTERTECLICKGKGGRQYIFKTPNYKTSNLIKHLQSIHNESDEYKQYLELKYAKEERHSSLEIDQHRISVESEALLQLTSGNNSANQQVENLTGESSNSNVMHTMSAWPTVWQRNHDDPIYQENETMENAPPLNHQQENQQQSAVGSNAGTSSAGLPRRQQLLLSNSFDNNSPTATSLTIIPANGIVAFKLHPGLGIWMSKIKIHNHGLIPQKFNVEITNSAVFDIMPEEYTLDPDKDATVDLTFEGDNFGSVAGSKFFVKAQEAGKENVWTFEGRIE